MHSTDAIFLRDRGELGFGFEGQLDDLIFRRPALQILAVVADRRQNLARMDRPAAVVAAKRLADQHPEVPTLGQVQHCFNAARGSPVLAE